MIALDELKKLPIEGRFQIVEELTLSIREEQADFNKSPELIGELRGRAANLRANPASGFTWDEVEARIRV